MGLFGVPATLSVIALLWHRFGTPTVSRERDETAGAWLAQQVTAQRLDVGLEMHAADGLDAYWPGVDRIGLSSRTWHSRRADDLAIAAHELGHALNIRHHWILGHLLPLARLARGFSWRAFAATGFVAWWLGATGLLPIATGFLIVSLVVSTVVCLDEAFASWRAANMLRNDASVTSGDLADATRSMRSAGAVYGVDWFGQFIVLAAWPFVLAAWPETPGSPGGAASPEAIGLAIGLVPVLLLRTAQVGLQVWDPEPVTTDFRLFTVMHRESQWEFLTGIVVLALVVLLHPLLSGPLATGALVMATMTAMGPVAGLARALVFLPVVLLVQAVAGPPEEGRPTFAAPSPDAAAPALLALYTDPPWYLRVSWLANLAYVPFLAVVALRLLG